MTKEEYLESCEHINECRSALDDLRLELDAEYIETAPFQVGDMVKCDIVSPSQDRWIIERIGVINGEFLYDVSPVVSDDEVRTHEHISMPISGDSLVKIN